MKERFYSLREKWLLGVLFLASLASLFFFLQYRTLAFPEHTISFAINRDQALAKAKQFASSQNLNPSSYKNATIFSSDTQSQTYLEREVGVADTSALAADKVDLWNFNTRFFKPLQQEEFSVSYMPNGRLVGYQHTIDETAHGATLSKDQAQKVAEQFLTRSTKQNLADWTLVSGDSTKRPNRLDYAFIYEKKNFKIKDATYRLEVDVQGDQIGAYAEALKVPEAWQRQYDDETSQNTLAQTVAESFALLLFGIALTVTFIIQFRNNNLRIRFSQKVALVATVVGILSALNSLPLDLFSYDTTVSWDAFIGGLVISDIFSGLMEGFLVFVAFAAGESLYRSSFPQKLSLEASFSKAFATKSVNKALFIGTFVGIIFFTYEIAYYFLGKQIGFWSPADINYDDIFSTAIPWVYPLFIGLSAAATEEGIFRLFGISFLKKYVKKTWIAVLITSVSWAFLHSNYPQSPWFVRGIELSMVGLVFGTIFVRYGLLASVTAHYTFNALQTAIFFTTSGSPYAIISSTIVSVIPFLLAVALLGWAIRRRGFLTEKKEFYNEHFLKSIAKVVNKVKENVPEVFVYKPLGRKTIALLIILSVISLVSFFKFGNASGVKQMPLLVDRHQALQKAEAALTQKGIGSTDFKNVVTFTDAEDAQAEDYIQEEADAQTVTDIYPSKIPTEYWTVRFFKPLQKEEYEVDVLPNGNIYQIDYTLDEKAKGANLTPKQALQLAQNYLTHEKHYTMTNYTVVENTADKKAHRTDYHFAFEQKNAKVADATFRTSVDVKGNAIAGFSQYLKLPQDWVREKQQTTTFDFISGAVLSLIVLLIISLGVATFLRFTRDKQIPFNRSFKFAGVATIFSVIGILNNIPIFYSNYDTAIPLSTFTIQAILLSIVGMVVGFFFFSLVVAMFLALWKYDMKGFFPEDTPSRYHYLRDSVLAAYLTPFVLSGVSIIIVALFATHDTLKTVTNFDSLTGLDTSLPFVSTVSSLPELMIILSLLASTLLVLYKYFKKWKKVLLFLLFFVILAAMPQQHSLTDYLLTLGESVFVLAGVSLTILFVLRKNLLSYILLTYVTIFSASGLAYLEQPKTFYTINGAILILLALLPLLLYIGWKFRRVKALSQTPT